MAILNVVLTLTVIFLGSESSTKSSSFVWILSYFGESTTKGKTLDPLNE